MSTLSAAQSPLSVSRESDGGQSRRMKSYSFRDLGNGRAHLRKRFRQRVLQTHLPLRKIDQLDLGAGKLPVGWDKVETSRLRAKSDLVYFSFSKQHMVHCESKCTLIDAGTHGRVALGIEIDQEHAALHRREARREIHTGRGLTDPTFLVGDGDDLGHCARTSMITRCRRPSMPGIRNSGTSMTRKSDGNCCNSSCG